MLGCLPSQLTEVGALLKDVLGCLPSQLTEVGALLKDVLEVINWTYVSCFQKSNTFFFNGVVPMGFFSP